MSPKRPRQPGRIGLLTGFSKHDVAGVDLLDDEFMAVDDFINRNNRLALDFGCYRIMPASGADGADPEDDNGD